MVGGGHGGQLWVIMGDLLTALGKSLAAGAEVRVAPASLSAA